MRGDRKTMQLFQLGVVKQADGRAWLDILPEYQAALLGLEEFSHIWVYYWFDRHDNPEARSTLRVHPRRDPAIPLHGVFATRSPRRPNLIAMELCELKAISGTRVEVDRIDALENSPVIDIKPHIPESDCQLEARVPEWLSRPWPAKKGEVGEVSD